LPAAVRIFSPHPFEVEAYPPSFVPVMALSLAERSAQRLASFGRDLQLFLEKLWHSGLCEALEACSDGPESLQQRLHTVLKVDELYKQLRRLASKQGVAYSAKGLEKPALPLRLGFPEEGVLAWFDSEAPGFLGELRYFLHVMQVEDSPEYKAHFVVLMPLLNASTQQLRILCQKAVKRGDLEKTGKAQRPERGEERPDGGDEAPKRKKKEEDPLKAAVLAFAASALYSEYVPLVFGKKRSLPELVAKQKAAPSPASPEELRAVCQGFLASLKKAVDELRAGGCGELYIKTRAEEWYTGRERDGDEEKDYLPRCLKVMVELMDAEPRPEPAALKKEQGVGEVPETLEDDVAEVVAEVVHIE